jgi:hypothetical protein
MTMKPKIDCDPLFESNGRRRYGPIRSIGLLLIAVALSGVALRAGPIPAPRPGPRPVVIAPMSRGALVLQGPVQNSPIRVVQRPDRFLIRAREDIDPKMVVRARPDIDPEMVFNPETGRRGFTPIDPASAINPYFAVPVPIPAPAEPRTPR